MIEVEEMGEDGNAELVENLVECLSNAVVFKFKAHGHHWNVMGPDFAEFHEFFGEIYEDVEGSIDQLAELIRQRGAKAPYRLVDFARNSAIADGEVGGDAMAMLHDLLEGNKVMTECLSESFAAATAVNDQGAANVLADRLSAHSKLNWQLSAFLGQEAIPGATAMSDSDAMCPNCGMPMSQCVCGNSNTCSCGMPLTSAGTCSGCGMTPTQCACGNM